MLAAALCDFNFLKFAFQCCMSMKPLFMLLGQAGDEITWPDPAEIAKSPILEIAAKVRSTPEGSKMNLDDVAKIKEYAAAKNVEGLMKAYVDISNLSRCILCHEESFPNTATDFIAPFMTCNVFLCDNFATTAFFMTCNALVHILIQSGNGTAEDLQDMGAGNNAQPEAQPQPRRSRMVGKMKEDATHQSTSALASTDRCVNAFKNFDTNGDGQIDALELATGLTMMGNTTTAAQATEMIQKAGGGARGSVSMGEFRAMMTGGFVKPTAGEKAMPAVPENMGGSEIRMAQPVVVTAGPPAGYVQVSVVVPPGMAAGSYISVPLPNGGGQTTVCVPQGVAAGQSFMVNVPSTATAKKSSACTLL